MLDCLAGLLVGSGIGAYNARELRPCLDGTLKVTQQKAGKAGCDCGPAGEKAKQAVDNAKQSAAAGVAKAKAALGMGPKPSPAGASRLLDPAPA
ncbi:unnamed protein product [Polarella glacialis]|uniref:Uncharacterized protein n=1 Tax=Polarella glacialis TaxID=89957 RepID=A0A813IUV4_POLGL|nr:unnamed protein product [Polarella glacialis]